MERLLWLQNTFELDWKPLPFCPYLCSLDEITHTQALSSYTKHLSPLPSSSFPSSRFLFNDLLVALVLLLHSQLLYVQSWWEHFYDPLHLPKGGR